MKVVSPRFSLAQAAQSTPASAMANTISLTLQTNVELLGGGGEVAALDDLMRGAGALRSLPQDAAYVFLGNLTGAAVVNATVSLKAVTGGREGEGLFCVTGSGSAEGTWGDVGPALVLRLCPGSRMVRPEP